MPLLHNIYMYCCHSICITCRYLCILNPTANATLYVLTEQLATRDRTSRDRERVDDDHVRAVKYGSESSDSICNAENCDEGNQEQTEEQAGTR